MDNLKNKKTEKSLRGLETEKWMEGLWDRLLDKISKTNSKNEVKNVLERLISKDEKKMILRRLGVSVLVRSGRSYHEIGDILWISHATISTIKKNIFDNPKSYKSYRDFYGGPRKYSRGPVTKKSLLEDIDLWDLFKNPPRPPGTGLKS